MFFMLSRNQYQLSPFSPSANAMAKEATICYYQLPQLSGFVALYLPVRKVPSMQMTGPHNLKASCRNPMPRMTAEAQACLVSPHKDSP
jgi:hypothetical protein